MSDWTPDQQLHFDIAFSLKKVTLPGFRRAVAEEDRARMASVILEHLKMSRWEFNRQLPEG
jgi:hypothetical protein